MFASSTNPFAVFIAIDQPPKIYTHLLLLVFFWFPGIRILLNKAGKKNIKRFH